MEYHNKRLCLLMLVSFLGLSFLGQKRKRNDDLGRRSPGVTEWELGEQYGRHQALEEVRVIAHGQLQAHVFALQHYLTLAEAAPTCEYRVWVRRGIAQAQQLHKQVVRLHRATSETLFSTNLEQAVRDSTSSLCAAYPRCSTRVEVVGQLVGQLAPKVEQALMLVLYNALQNAYKHAHSSSILVQLQYSADTASLVVTNDGRGFSVKHARFRGRGLEDMERLTRQQGGSLCIHSSPNRGTRVTATFPYAHAME